MESLGAKTEWFELADANRTCEEAETDTTNEIDPEEVGGGEEASKLIGLANFKACAEVNSLL
jgi:hypothetical protein